MNDLIHFWVLVSAVTSTIATAFGIALVRSQRRTQELERLLLERTALEQDSQVSEEVVRRLDDVAAQVDRLADGQDFLARLLADRRPDLPRPLNETARPTTPH